MTKQLTLCLAVEGDKILLGMKKLCFGAGRYNCYGGKLQEGESIEDAARREMEEECGVKVTEMEEVGVHMFEFSSDPGNFLEVHVFRVDAFEGSPEESEEMKPQWFDIDKIPYDTMWPDDRYWIPLFLEGKKFKAQFLFGEGDGVLKQDIQVVEKL